MSGISILLDTNIVLYLLNGDTVLQHYLEGKSYYLSFINELELLGFKNITEKDEKAIEFFVDECAMFDFNAGIKEITIQLRRRHTSLKLPDAIIAATAIFLGIPLLSADKHFEGIADLTFVRYEP